MAEYIDKERLLNHWVKLLEHNIYGTLSIETLKHDLENMPTADVEEVKHGHWIELINSSYSPFDGTSEYIYICSECGRKEGKRETYCHCGAKMDEEVE